MFWIGKSQTEVISKQIADDSPQGNEQTAFLTTVISEFEGSEFRKYMDGIGIACFRLLVNVLARL